MNNMTRAEKIKIPKLTNEDRIKLIDKPDLLVVVPKTQQASIRYGAGSKWCTSTPSNKTSFNKYTQQGFLTYIIYYNTLNDDRITEKTKVGLFIQINIKQNIMMVQGWDKQDNQIEKEILEHIVITPEINDILIKYTKNYIIDKYGYDIGSEIKCTNHQGNFDLIKVNIKSNNYESLIYLKPYDINTAIVTKINEHSIRANIKELSLKTDLDPIMKNQLINEVNSGKLNVNIPKKYILTRKENNIPTKNK